jgi:hypothetical protein
METLVLSKKSKDYALIIRLGKKKKNINQKIENFP